MDEQLIDIVRKNLNKIDHIRDARILSLSAGVMKGRNRYSTRPGGPVTISYSKNNEVATKKMWAKTVELPRQSYEALRCAYEGAASHGISDPIPEPYFYDERKKLVFMDMKTGVNLLRLALQYVFIANVFPNDELRRLFYGIGRWLQEFHATVVTGETVTLKAVVDEIAKELWNSSLFVSHEKRALSVVLGRIAKRKIAGRSFQLIRPHNDFTLRNIFATPNGGFYVIDWDAMVHPYFPSRALGWWDLTTLIINLQSMAKLSPIIKYGRIQTLCNAVTEGYCSANRETKGISYSEFLHNMYFVYTLKYWLGVESDRPLNEIYRRSMGRRYTQKLRQSLLKGRADILGAL